MEAERLGHAEELRGGAGAAHAALAGDDDAADAAPRRRRGAGHAGAAGRGQRQRPGPGRDRHPLDELGYLAADVATDLGSYLADADIDPARLERVQERRAELGDAAPGSTATASTTCCAWADDAARRVAELEGADDRIGELEPRGSRP